MYDTWVQVNTLISMQGQDWCKRVGNDPMIVAKKDAKISIDFTKWKCALNKLKEKIQQSVTDKLLLSVEVWL